MFNVFIILFNSASELKKRFFVYCYNFCLYTLTINNKFKSTYFIKTNEV